jgi:hypothetical protein
MLPRRASFPLALPGRFVSLRDKPVITWKGARPEVGRRRGPNARRTPNAAFRDWDRSARLGPSRQRCGSRKYGKRQAAAHRRCNPAFLSERRLRPSAAGAPARRRGFVPSGGGPSASYRASRRRRQRGSGSKPYVRRRGPAPRLRTPRLPRSPTVCSLLIAWPHPWFIMQRWGFERILPSSFSGCSILTMVAGAVTARLAYGKNYAPKLGH